MIALIKYIWAKVPAHWWRNGARMVLVPISTFYLLHIANDMNLLARYKTLWDEEYLVYFIVLQVAVSLLFYPVLDFILRLLFHKIVKRYILAQQAKVTESKVEYLRGLAHMRNWVVGFFMGYPVELGYIKRSEINDMALEKITITESQKEEALNEILIAFNKWACIIIHLLVTLLVVYKYNQPLMISLIITGLFLTLVFFSVVILFIKNFEVIDLIQKEIVRRNKQKLIQM